MLDWLFGRKKEEEPETTPKKAKPSAEQHA
jgi:hypothetical protein